MRVSLHAEGTPSFPHSLLEPFENTIAELAKEEQPCGI